MGSSPLKIIAIAAALAGVSACKTQSAGSTAAPQGTADTGNTGTTNGTDTSGGTGTTGSTGGSGTSLPGLVSVNLQNVLNDLSISLQVDRNSIPVTAQVPVDVAASVCGVSVDALAASVASGHATCTATTSSPQLVQVVQQQISTGGSVTGGDQTTTVPTGNLI